MRVLIGMSLFVAKEDENICKDSQSNYGNSAAGKMKSRKKPVPKLRNLVSCFYPDAIRSSTKDSDTSSEDEDGSSSIQTELLRPLSQQIKVYQIRKDVEFLHVEQNCPLNEDDDSSVCDPSLESFVAKAKRGPGRNAGPAPVRKATSEDSERTILAAMELEEVWDAQPSQRFLDAIASNMAPPKKFATTNFVYDHDESKIREVIEALKVVRVEDKLNLKAEKEAEESESRESIDESHIIRDEPGANDAIDQREKQADSEVEIAHESEWTCPPPLKLMSTSMKRQIESIKEITNKTHEIVKECIWNVRQMERNWLSPTDLRPKSATNSDTQEGDTSKELNQLLDFIVETAKLTENPVFTSRIYPEDKHEIVSVLDPVLKELTNCFMSIFVLHNLVEVDGKYLKELVAAFPKGNLVLRDWVSNPSLHEDLEQIDNSFGRMNMSEFDVDVDELFE